jgi:2-amino-4-hydroxy-6-hydroxymethyldihydropteridine diphosphokinase
METCYVGIGSNLGNRRANIKAAVARIKELKDTRLVRLSSIIETEPVGGPSGQPKFLNAALKIQTRIPPARLLQNFKRIEKDMGRVPGVRYGPRAIDLDILLYGSRIVRSKNLIIPHPRMFSRLFVLKPLAEVI